MTPDIADARALSDSNIDVAELALRSNDGIGESPAWDRAKGHLLWVDHEGRAIHQASLSDNDAWTQTRRWDWNGALAAAIPRASGGMVVVGGSEVALMADDGSVSTLAKFDFEHDGVRLTEAKCDPRGRLWVGALSVHSEARVGLYRITADGNVTPMLDGVKLSNGMDWSPDGSLFYFIDSLRASVDVFDFDLSSGDIANRRTLVTIDPRDGVPNGMCVDDEGRLWVALTCGAEIRVFSPQNGALLKRLGIGVPGVTSCAFGGASGQTLFITTRSGRVPDIIKQLGAREEMMESSGPLAGALFTFASDTSGPAATPFCG